MLKRLVSKQKMVHVYNDDGFSTEAKQTICGRWLVPATTGLWLGEFSVENLTFCKACRHQAFINDNIMNHGPGRQHEGPA